MKLYCVKQLIPIMRKPGFWATILLFILITVLHFHEILLNTILPGDIFANIGLTRHAFERTLFLLPIILAGSQFGWTGSFFTTLAALAVMIPRVLYISQYQTDSFFETAMIFAAGMIMTVTFRALHKEKALRIRLESYDKKLQESEESYRKLFENAHDAIFIYQSEGNLVAANRTCAELTGYNTDELHSMKVVELLSEESFLVLKTIEQLLASGENAGWTAELKLLKKNQTPADIQLSVSMINHNEKSATFMCAARDVGDQKRMQENMQYYLQQATRAQEEERKRIALELHDDTIQELVVLSRQLDVLAAKGREILPENSLILKDLRQQAKNIIESLRHLSQNLRPATLDRLGLLPAIDYLASEMRKHSDIATSVTVLGTQHRLPEESELVLFRITQEALRNVGRHSRASKADITLEFTEQKVRVTIRDDGRGFYLPVAMETLSKNGKLGLVGMQERARLINGHLSIQSEPGKGTIVIIEVSI